MRRGTGGRLFVAMLIAMVTGCSADGATGTDRGANVVLNFLTPSTVRMIAVSVTGPGITPAVTRNIPVGADSVARDTLVLTAGSGRRFTFSAFDSSGVETHRADTTVTLLAGSNAPLAVRLRPLSSSVGVTVTFGGVRIAVPDTTERFVGIGDTLRIQATGAWVTSAPLPADSLRWGTSNPAVARVIAGVVTGVRPGTAMVTVSYGGAAAVVRVTVPITSVGADRSYLSVGGSHACALTASGTAYCWGRNSDGQLGDSSLTTPGGPVRVGGGRTFATVTAGFNFTCALDGGGAAFCWGKNDRGQLGNSLVASATYPVSVSGGTTFVAITAGGSHTCGLTGIGEAFCWGSNQWGQLGDGTATSRSVPTRVATELRFARLEASWHSTCALTVGGTAYCWGDNSYGELGDSTVIARNTPRAVAGGRTFLRLSRQHFGHACAVTIARSAFCWGLNDAGQVGDASLVSRAVPAGVGGGATYEVMSAGGYHTCGVDPFAVARCWGYNLYGQLGIGTNANVSTPQVIDGFRFRTIDTGSYFTCAIDLDGVAHCWGANGTQELGIASTGDRNRPTPVAGGLRFGP